MSNEDEKLVDQLARMEATLYSTDDALAVQASDNGCAHDYRMLLIGVCNKCDMPHPLNPSEFVLRAAAFWEKP